MQNITEGYVHVQSTYKLCIARAAVNENVCMYKPVARIFRRGVTWMSNLHKHTRLGRVWGHAPPGNF